MTPDWLHDYEIQLNTLCQDWTPFMATIKHKGVVYKLSNIKIYTGGLYKPRFEPGPSLRKAGWRGFDFKDENGNWLPMDETIDAAKTQIEKIEKWRTDPAAKNIDASAPRHVKGSFGLLFHAYQIDDKFRSLKPKTRKDYSYAIKAITNLIGADTPLPALDRPRAIKLYAKLRKEHGPSSANHHMRVFKSIMRFGEDIGLVKTNPTLSIRLTGVPPRVRFLTTDEINALVDTADKMGLPSVGDLIIAGVGTGQRQGDLMRLPSTIATLDEYQFKQSKRGRIAVLPKDILDGIRPRMKQALARATKLTGATPLKPFVSEKNIQPYNGSNHFGKLYRAVRTEAAKIAPSVSDAQFMDLRDTCLTRLVDAGCTISEVCAIMGHKESSALQVWQHYLAANPERARSAGKKYAGWKKDNKVRW